VYEHHIDGRVPGRVDDRVYFRELTASAFQYLPFFTKTNLESCSHAVSVKGRWSHVLRLGPVLIADLLKKVLFIGRRPVPKTTGRSDRKGKHQGVSVLHLDAHLRRLAFSVVVRSAFLMMKAESAFSKALSASRSLNRP
jgi:hypothetical protein